MAKASRRLASDEMSARTGLKYGDGELGQLAKNFDEMAIALEQRQAERELAEMELKRSQELFRNLSTHLQVVREEERTRIARKIHDDMGQALTALKIDLTWLNKKLTDDQPLIREKLQSMVTLINETIETVHNLSEDLRPGILDDFGLAAAIQWQTEDFQSRTGIACSVILDTEADKLTQDESTALFRIFQETLTNTLRHAAATEIGVHLWEEENQLMLEIADNGKGIADTEISSPMSLGLIGMRERVYGINGSIQLSGIQDKGTRVTVAIPLNGKRVSHA